MSIINVKGVLCCEFSVRIDADGSESVGEIKNLSEEVFEKFKDQIIENVLFENSRPVGEFFKLTIGFDEKKFFLPKRSISKIGDALNNLKGSCKNGREDIKNVYTPKHQL